MKYVKTITLITFILAAAACNRIDNSKLPKLSAKGYERQLSTKNGIAAWIFEEGGKQGLRDTLGNIILPAKYDYIEDWIQFGVVRVDSGGLDKSEYDYVHYEMNKIGLIDYKGNVIFEPQFDELEFGGFPLALVKKKNKFGFINSKGEFVIDMKFDGAGIFHNGFAVVETKGKQGLINDIGEFIVNPEYDSIFHGYATGFSKDTMILMLDRKGMMINNNGEIFDPVKPADNSTHE
jgi:hypothetical protein